MYVAILHIIILIDSAGRDVFCKLCLTWHVVHHSLPPVWHCNNLWDNGHSYELPNLWPPNSPDLSPINYKIWGNEFTRQKCRMCSAAPLKLRYTRSFCRRYRNSIIFFCPTKPRAWKLSKMFNNGCNDFLFGVHCVDEGDRIPPVVGGLV